MSQSTATAITNELHLEFSLPGLPKLINLAEQAKNFGMYPTPQTIADLEALLDKVKATATVSGSAGETVTADRVVADTATAVNEVTSNGAVAPATAVDDQVVEAAPVAVRNYKIIRFKGFAIHDTYQKTIESFCAAQGWGAEERMTMLKEIAALGHEADPEQVGARGEQAMRKILRSYPPNQHATVRSNMIKVAQRKSREIPAAAAAPKPAVAAAPTAEPAAPEAAPAAEPAASTAPEPETKLTFAIARKHRVTLGNYLTAKGWDASQRIQMAEAIAALPVQAIADPGLAPEKCVSEIISYAAENKRTITRGSIIQAAKDMEQE